MGTPIICTFTDATFLATSKYLEHITTIQVDGDRTPYLGFHTLTATKHVERLTQYVHTLFRKDDTTISLSDVILIVTIEFILTRLILFHFVEEPVTVDDRAVDIDDDITIDETGVEATSIDVTTIEATIQVFIGTGAFPTFCHRINGETR